MDRPKHAAQKYRITLKNYILKFWYKVAGYGKDPLFGKRALSTYNGPKISVRSACLVYIIICTNFYGILLW
jgi:hypothetical protein